MLRRLLLPVNFYSLKCNQRLGSTLILASSRKDEVIRVCAKRVARQDTSISFLRFFSESSSNKQEVDFEQVKKLLNNDNVFIIDVREPEEIKEFGKIPNSINIPLDKVHTTLSTMNEEMFKNTFKRSKPTEDSEIIFYCAIGKRSGKAQKSAYDLGYKNAKNYLGSYTDWSKKMK